MIEIKDYTCKVPLEMTGDLTGVCWGAKTGIPEKSSGTSADTPKASFIPLKILIRFASVMPLLNNPNNIKII